MISTMTGMNNCVIKNRRGFTLLEIMVSLVLICLVVVSVIQLSSANLRNLAASDDRIETLERANAKMREVLDSDRFKDKVWHEVDAEGYAYDISFAEILKERSDALSVKLVEITVSMQSAKDKGSKKITLKTAKMISKSDALKSQ